MLSVKVSTKNQISVPSDARRRLGIQAGDRLSVEITTDAIVLRRRPERPSERLRGLGADVWKDTDPVAYVRELRDESER
jgi:AbrB family looped-hinge helix DNA binding protein